MAQRFQSELKVPAHLEFIPVAKRVAASLGSLLGFSIEEIDELCIAVAQACDNTIEAAQDAWGAGATLKLAYSSTDRGIAVDVEAVAPTSPQALPVARPARRGQDEAAEAQRRLARDMISLFVDDYRQQVEPTRGQIRFRMVKYLIS